MTPSAATVLRRLGEGETIAAAWSAAGGADREAFDTWWGDQLRSRLPDTGSERRGAVTSEVEIRRDAWGVPHLFARHHRDLVYGLGFVMAQDRLWQLDVLRREALGRLAEILGPEALERDRLARTVGLNRITDEQLGLLPGTTLELLEAFSAGVDAVIAECEERLPIEFDLLGYRPEPWTPRDCLAIWIGKRWYSSGRLPVIALAELARKRLADETLFRAFLTAEADDESIVPAGSYPPAAVATAAHGGTVSDPEEGLGSNNWAVAGARSASGRPQLASDPHNPFSILNERYEFHLCGDGLNVAGATLLGIPAVIFGRNERVAWGLTNNICSQRDLYRERTSTEHPGCFLHDGRWEPARELVEEIAVKGADPVMLPVRLSRNGPVVTELLPGPCRDGEPVSLRWAGTAPSDEISCLLAANRAASCAEFRAALQAWRTPSWSFVFADAGGHIGYQCVGGLPLRADWDRGYRAGWEPAQQWQGFIPFEALPALDDPARGWVASANNRTAPDDFPYPLGGTWSSSHRARRIRQLIEERERFPGTRGAEGPPPGFVAMQHDVVSLRAVEALPPLLDLLRGVPAGRLAETRELLTGWDGNLGPEDPAAAVFEAFFLRWQARVANERFEGVEAELLNGMLGGLALELLSTDAHGWFAVPERRHDAILEALEEALDDLERRLGGDMSGWAWGRLHTLTLRHPLSDRGELGALLDRGPYPLGGSLVTVCNAAHDSDYQVTSGANFRIIADLGEEPPALWAVNAAGQSGQPGSRHYGDQTDGWRNGRYHRVVLTGTAAGIDATSGFRIRPDTAREG